MQTIIRFLHQTLPRIWQTRGLIACLLWPLSLLYAAGWRKKKKRQQQLASQRSLPVPVLVVGNVIVGGAGKTPTTLAVVQHFQQQGLHVGVVSRGYGRATHAPACMAVNAQTPAQLAGDEPLLIHCHTGAPVFVCADRFQAAQALLQQHPHTQLIICDDGLQHLALPRDGEICVMDERGIGNGWMLPAGPLREPWPRYTSLLLHTAHNNLTLPTNQPSFQAQRDLAEYAVNDKGEQQDISQWAHNKQPVIALAGIAQPQRFFDMLQAKGLHLAQTHALTDHIDAESLQQLAKQLEQQGMPVLCTEKDLVKLLPQRLPQQSANKHTDTANLWAVPLVLRPEPAFFTALDHWWVEQQKTRGIL